MSEELKVHPAGAVIWVVEDDVSTQRLIAHTLRAHGLSPVLFGTAESAYAALRAGQQPALIVLDMMLPGMSGVDLIRLIKKNATWEKIPVVVVTVLSREDAQATGAEASSAIWMNKPFDTNHLLFKIQEILNSVGLGSKGSSDG